MKTNHKSLPIALFTLIMQVLFAGDHSWADDIYVSCWGGNPYIGTIEKIDENGNPTTFATGLDFPTGLTFDNSGNLFVAERMGQKIKRFDSSGNMTVFASGLYSPWGIAFNSEGNLFVAGEDGSIDKIDSGGNISLFGSSQCLFDLAFDGSGNLYASNSNMGSETIDKFDLNGNKTTFCSEIIPMGLAFDDTGYLYVAEYAYAEILKFNSTGNRTIFAKGAYDPGGITFDSSGNLYMVDRGNGTIEKFDSSGHRSTFATGLNNPVFITTQIPEPATILLLGLGAAMIRKYKV